MRTALGSFGVALARLARGEDQREVEPYREAKSYGEENTFERDVADARRARGRSAPTPKRSRAVSGAIACAAWRHRRSSSSPVRSAAAAIRCSRARCSCSVATDDGAAIARAALRLLARVEPWEPIRLIGVAVTRLEPSDDSQLALTLGGETEQRRSRLNAAVDAIHARFGDEKLRRGTADVRRAALSVGIKRGERD